MAPNFALDLSEDGIELLHRAPDGAGWYREGRLDFASDDIAEGLAGFRKRALELEGDGFQTKLILPTSQLLYTSVPVGTDVAATLEDRTPYRIDQLIYDTSQKDGEMKIVAVALETLGEAEGFIGPHALNPVGFTARPDEGRFFGEPMLGGMLESSGGFDVDAEPVRVIEKPQAVSEAPDSEPEPKTHEINEADDLKNLFVEEASDTSDDPAVLAADKPEISKPANATEQASVTDTAKLALTAENSAGRSPAAFSTRRQLTEDQNPGDAGTHVSKLSARIAVPGSAPKLGAASDAPRPATKDADKAPKTKKLAPPTSSKAKTKPAPKVTPVAVSKQAPSAPKKTAPPAALAQELAKERDPLARLTTNEQRGKPRFLGLIMTAILLVCLGLAALLSSYVLPDDALSRFFGNEISEETELAAAPVEPIVTEDPLTELPIPEAIELATLPPENVPPVFDDAQEFVEPELLPAPPAPAAEMTQAEAQTAYAVSGIWQRTDTLSTEELATESLDELYIASLDPNPAFEDAPALIPQTLDNGETELASFTRPPPPGIIFDIDERGLVRPTPEGTLNPDGITVFLGPPPVVAVQRPGGSVEATPAPETAEPEAVVEAPALSAEQLRLAAIRPAQRPDDLSERRERATLGGLSRPELANIRPQQRPVSAQLQAQAIARALLEVEEADAASVEAALAAATRQAVNVSLRAQQRPQNFAAIVQTARAARQAAPSAQVQTASASTASAAARATGPAVARSSRINPTGPVSGRVARAATESNAISLGNVALVGVFGTSANRRALVRMPNGRFRKVSIGDRVDGGRVAAIDGNSLRYTKGGRTVTLQMPSS
jgi:hypothetical protein